jgi:hypothetical protein
MTYFKSRNWRKCEWWLGLAIIDLGWSLIAWIYDWASLQSIPLYWWPFIVICPLFPLLLGLGWWGRWRGFWLKVLPWAALPSITYGFLAPFFYGAHSYYTGFVWQDVGQVLWVWAYAFQALFLMRVFKVSLSNLVAAALFMLVALTSQYLTLSLHYLDLSSIPHDIVRGLYILGIVFTLIFSFLQGRKT